ncbi:hypothetical protein AB835_11420 [Candidatus Endobugula sertula]|uniref:Tryptophan 2-monooxygenase n=1 Tax=Candidatus Endobugula sertula TaxID=62101 RepID=A0A1D2QN01_9GAMM|nr:hypothetical protein AB835_11420 [Candidatus Endobugula sertula]
MINNVSLDLMSHYSAKHIQIRDAIFKSSALSNITTTTKALNIAIIGAGLSGLVAAFELEALGYKVTIFEANTRAGGKIYTQYFGEHLHGELGAMRIPAHHSLVMQYVNRFGLAYRQNVSTNNNAYYYLNGVCTRKHNSRILWPETLAARVGIKNPDTIYKLIVNELLNQLTPEEFTALLTSKANSELLLQLDQLSFLDYFAQKLEPLALNVVAATSGVEHYRRVSCLSGLVDEINWGGDQFFELAEGMSRLVTAFIKHIKGEIHFGSQVEAISLYNNKVNISVKANNVHQNFDSVICCIPTYCLRKIKITPELPLVQRQAISQLKYSNAAKSLVVTNRLWELNDSIFGGSSITDLSIHQCYYPSDNAILDNGRWKALSSDVSHSLGVLTAGYRWENFASQFATLNNNAKDSSTLADINRLHQGLRKSVKDITHQYWPDAYAFYMPGERAYFQDLLNRPFPLNSPRIFFAGEHLSISHGSLHGAVETAHHAVNLLVNTAEERYK